MKRILLLQARSSVDMEVQELQCFVERCRLAEKHFTTLNLARHSIPESPLEGMDAFMIGGAGEFSATGNYGWMPFVLDLIRRAIDQEVPTFGSCWGHQLIARALGGRVEHDKSRAELGCMMVHLTSAGRSDPLLKPFPSSFMANMGHHDRVTRLPNQAIELARSDSQPYQAFRLREKPVYSTQFHSELNAHRERERLIRYRPYYMDEIGSDEQFRAVMESLAETTEVDHLLSDFVDMFVGR